MNTKDGVLIQDATEEVGIFSVPFNNIFRFILKIGLLVYAINIVYYIYNSPLNFLENITWALVGTPFIVIPFVIVAAVVASLLAIIWIILKG
jgi:hypothetical protein